MGLQLEESPPVRIVGLSGPCHLTRKIAVIGLVRVSTVLVIVFERLLVWCWKDSWMFGTRLWATALGDLFVCME